MDHNERDRRDPPDAEDAGPSSAESAPVADEGTAEPIDSSATAEIESWPSQDASASSASAAATPETAAWSTEPPVAGSAAVGDWPTDPPERGDEPILAPDWPTASDREAHDDAPPPSEVEAYPAPSMAPRDADPDAGGAADGSVAATAAHAVPAGEGAVGESTQCPRCGTENRPGLAFCRNCGQRLVAAGVASTVERPGTPEGTMACPRCGTHNRAGVAFCQNCGANLRGTAPGYVPPAVAADAGVEADQVERRGAILGPVVLLIGLVGIITGYLLVSLMVVGAFAFALGVWTDAPLAAVGGAVLLMILSAILNSITALGGIREGLPGHYAFAWADALSATIDYSDMATGALWSIGYAIVLVGLAVWHFLRKDITS